MIYVHSECLILIGKYLLKWKLLNSLLWFQIPQALPDQKMRGQKNQKPQGHTCVFNSLTLHLMLSSQWDGKGEPKRERETEREGRERRIGGREGGRGGRKEKLTCIFLVSQSLVCKTLALATQSSFCCRLWRSVLKPKISVQLLFVITIPFHFSGNHLRAVCIESAPSCLK